MEEIIKAHQPSRCLPQHGPIFFGSNWSGGGESPNDWLGCQSSAHPIWDGKFSNSRKHSFIGPLSYSLSCPVAKQGPSSPNVSCFCLRNLWQPNHTFPSIQDQNPLLGGHQLRMVWCFPQKSQKLPNPLKFELSWIPQNSLRNSWVFVFLCGWFFFCIDCNFKRLATTQICSPCQATRLPVNNMLKARTWLEVIQLAYRYIHTK